MGEEATLIRLREAGIPREAIATTLAKEKRMDLREYIQNKAYDTKPIASVVGLDRLPFYLTAKEMALSGFRVYCCELVDIHTALFSERDEADQIAATIEDAQVIAISGFYEQEGNVAPFLNPYESAYFRSWFMRKVNAGVKVILQVEMDVAFAGTWYSGALLHFIGKHCAEFGKVAK